MNIIINAGSENKGGTLEQAKINAKEWLDSIHNQGFLEVNMEFKEKNHGDFDFDFKHSVTKVVVKLGIHGFTKEECDKFVCHPRVYWNGSSSADPEIEDWLTDEHKIRIQYCKIK